MGNRYYFCKFLAFAFLLLAKPAVAETVASYDNDFHLKGIYEFTADGLLFGRLGIETQPAFSNAITPERKASTITVDVKSAGAISLFTHHSSHTTLKIDAQCSTCRANGFSEYETRYMTKKKPRHVVLVYHYNKFIQENVEPPEDPIKRPPVQGSIKDHAVDPLNFLVHIHDKLEELLRLKQTNFSINVYDGRRVTLVDFTFTGKQTISYEGNPTPVIALTVKRKPYAGFTEKELADIGSNEPSATFYVEDKPALTPLRLEVHVWFGTLAATLVKRCSAEESCLLGNTE